MERMKEMAPKEAVGCTIDDDQKRKRKSWIISVQ
jgi:hypothetical protein